MTVPQVRGWAWAGALALAVGMAACAEPPPRVEVDAAGADLGLVVVGEEVSRYVAVTNPGDAPVEVRPALEDASGAFSVLPPLQGVAPHGTARIRVDFRPEEAGVASATLSLEVVDSEAEPEQVALAAEGVEPDALVPARTLDFGTTPVGEVRTRTLILTNPTSRALDMSLTPPPDGLFGVDRTVVALQPGAQEAVEVSYAPSVEGLHERTLEVRWSAERSPIEVVLSGEARLEQPLVWSHERVDFGSVPPGREVAVEVQVTNATAGLVEVRTWLTAADSEDPPAPAFQADAGVLRLKGGLAGTVTVRFSPTDALGRQAKLRWSADFADAARASGGHIWLMGDGEAPWLAVPETLAFGRTGVGAYTDGTVVLENRGTAMARVDLPTGDGPFGFAPGGTVLEIAPGAREAVGVRFAPEAAGLHGGTLHLESNDPFLPTADVALTGEAVAVEGCEAVLPDVVDAGHATVGETVTTALHLSVPADAAGPCLVSMARLEGPDAAIFSLPGLRSDGYLVAPGEAVDLPVAFAPTAGVDPADATLRLYVGDPAAPVRTVAVTGWAGIVGLRADTDSFRFSDGTPATDNCALPLCFEGSDATLGGPWFAVVDHPDASVQATWAASTPLAGERCLLVKRGDATEPQTGSLWVNTWAGRSDPVRLDLGVTGTYVTHHMAYPVADLPQVDVLVVMDDSLDAGVWRSWDDLAAELLPPEVRGDFDYHVAVVAGTLTGTDVHSAGVLLPEPPSNRPRVVTPALTDPVSNLIEQFRDGRGPDEAPWMLEAMRAALSPRRTEEGGVNAGFLRPGVPLSVVFLSGSGDDRLHHASSLFEGLLTRLGRSGHPLKGFALVAPPDAGTACEAGPTVTGTLADFVSDHGGVVLPRCPGISYAPLVSEVFGAPGVFEFPLPEPAADWLVPLGVSVVGTDGVERSATGWQTLREGNHTGATGVRFDAASAPMPGETVRLAYRRLSLYCTWP